MDLRFATLNVHVPFRALADVLNLPVRSEALPLRTDCPFCGGRRLTIYQDNTTGGQWHHCPCGARGDMIELAARAWKLSVPAAVNKLRRHGFAFPDGTTDADVAAYVDNHIGWRRHVNELWQNCRKYLTRTDSKSVAYLRNRFRLVGQLAPDRWDAGPGRLMGAYPARELKHATVAGNSPNTKARLFRGRGWEDVLVFPYHAAPERPCGFYFVGRAGEAADRQYKSVQYIPRGRQRDRREAGLWGLCALEDAAPAFHGYAFAVADPVAGMRLQVRHYASSRRPLPLVSWWDGGPFLTRRSWAAVGRRRVIFWGFGFDAAALYQAIACDGYVGVVPLDEVSRKSVDHYFRLGPPADLLRKAVKRARPWQEVLVGHAREGRMDVIEDLLLGLESYPGVCIRELAQELGHGIERVLESSPNRVLYFSDHLAVTEKEGGWYVTNKRQNRPAEVLLSDARFYVDWIVAGPKPRYLGRILFQGAEIPFDFPAAQMEKYTARCVITRCVEAGYGRPVIRTLTFWRKSLIDVALGFHKPSTFAQVAAEGQKTV